MSRLHAIYRDAARLAVPVEVMLELTHRCNFRCQHCYIPDFEAPDLLPTGRVLGLLDELAAMGTLVLALSGGEVLLRRDWLAVAQRARELGFDLHLFTNGWRVGEQEADAVAGLSATVHVSLYSLDEATFATITGRRGSLPRVLAGIEHLRARGVRTIVKVPLMTLNRGDVGAVREYAARVGAECQISPVILAKKDGDTAPLHLRVPLEEAYSEVGGPIGGCRPADLDGPLCAAASRYCVITSSGDVMACNVLPGSGGNVRERPFREVWEGSPWLATVRGIRARDLHTCSGCSRLSYCGRCHAQALVEDGDLFGPATYARQRAEWLEARGLAGRE